MRDTSFLNGRLLRGAAASFASMLAVCAQAAAPGISGPNFSLSASPGLHQSARRDQRVHVGLWLHDSARCGCLPA